MRPSLPRIAAAGRALVILGVLAATALATGAVPALGATTTTTTKKVDPESLPIPEGSSSPAGLSGGAGGTLLRLGLGLVVVVGLIAAVWFVMKRIQRSRYPALDERGGSSIIDVVATTSLGPNRTLHLVRIGEEMVLVGATDHSVNAVARIGAEDAAGVTEVAPPGPGYARHSAAASATMDDRERAVATATGAPGRRHPGRAPARHDHAPPVSTLPASVPGPLPTLRERIVAAMPPPARTRRRRWLRRGFLLSPLVMALACIAWPAIASAAPAGINLNLNGKDGEVSTSLQLLALLTVLSLAPSILIMMTSFTRIIIVLGFVRNALGTPSMPPNQVLVGISLFLSLFVMAPTFTQINDQALQPLMDKKIDEKTALHRAEEPIREFMFKQVDQKDLALFTELSKQPRPKTRADVPTTVLIPAYVLSELKTAFEIGFLILIPFLVIDMVIALTVMSMGMVMLPPVVISLPFKILLFVLVDGWHLVSESLVQGFMT